MSDENLDCTGLSCPMPIVRMSRAVKALGTRQTLSVTATDRAFKKDVEAWVKKTGNELVEFVDGDIQRAVIRKT